MFDIQKNSSLTCLGRYHTDEFLLSHASTLSNFFHLPNYFSGHGSKFGIQTADPIFHLSSITQSSSFFTAPRLRCVLRSRDLVIILIPRRKSKRGSGNSFQFRFPLFHAFPPCSSSLKNLPSVDIITVGIYRGEIGKQAPSPDFGPETLCQNRMGDPTLLRPLYSHNTSRLCDARISLSSSILPLKTSFSPSLTLSIPLFLFWHGARSQDSG